MKFGLAKVITEAASNFSIPLPQGFHHMYSSAISFILNLQFHFYMNYERREWFHRKEMIHKVTQNTANALFLLKRHGENLIVNFAGMNAKFFQQFIRSFLQKFQLTIFWKFILFQNETCRTTINTKIIFGIFIYAFTIFQCKILASLSYIFNLFKFKISKKQFIWETNVDALRDSLQWISWSKD